MLTSYIRSRAQNYDLGEMSIGLGVLSCIAIIPVFFISVVLARVSDASSAFVAGVLLWIGCASWLWISFVIVGRESTHTRVSTREFTRVQIVVAAVIGCFAVFATPMDRYVLRLFGNVFEWIIIGFHCIYFSLAWAIRVKIPVRTYLLFAVIVGIVLWRVGGSSIPA